MIFKLNDWGITARVFFLALVPVTLVTFVLGFYIINSRTEDLANEITSKGQVIADSLASASEFGVATENVNSLHSIVQAVQRNTDILRIGIYGSENQLVYFTERGDLQDEGAAPLSREFTSIIYRTDLAPDELLESTSEQPGSDGQEAIGYVKVYLSGEPFLERQNTILTNSIIISLVGLLLSVLLAMFISRGVTTPVRQLMAAVSYLRSGRYSTRIDKLTGGELGDLQKGINDMAEKIQISHQNLEQQVEKAVKRYKSSINELQKRNYELQVARRAAMRAGEAKSEFLANMSHEIRTPLNAIIGFGSRLKKTATNHEQSEYAHTVTAAANQLLSVVDDILNFSKLESGKMDIKPVDVDIQHVLEDIVTMMSVSAHEKGLELVLLVDSDVPQIVRVDADRLRQVLTNLISNAIKFTDVGDVLVHVSVLENNDKDVLRFIVADTGIGVDINEQKKLFTPFTQADMSPTRRYGGTGLGLVISKRIINLMKGDIRLESEKGKGATFYVDIPLDCRQQISDEHDVSLSGYSALLFDPHLYSRRALRNNLVHMGINTYTASSEYALESMLSDENCDAYYDVLIVSMPASSDPANISRQILPVVQKYYHGPVFVLTSDEEYVALQLANHEAKTAVALKPIRTDSLRYELSKIFGVNALENISNTLSPSVSSEFCHVHRVLVAEDNDFNRLYISRLLEDHGIKTDCVVDGQQAIDMATQHDYDLILMDVHMPVIDGVDAARFIRGELSEKCPPIVAVTADVFADETGVLTDSGFTECLLKPVNEQVLYDTINRVCKPDFVGEADTSLQQVSPDPENANALLEQVRHIPSDLLEKLIMELPEHLIAIRKYVNQSDLNSLRERLHMFLGVCSYFGITDLEAAIRALQADARNGDLSNAEDELQKIASIIERLETAWSAKLV